jgi:hypothetical protein
MTLQRPRNFIPNESADGLPTSSHFLSKFDAWEPPCPAFLETADSPAVFAWQAVPVAKTQAKQNKDIRDFSGFGGSQVEAAIFRA